MSKLLLVEDEDMLSMIIKDTMETRGYTVIAVNDGKKALDVFTLEKPDLVILDIMLPTTNGYVVALQIREKDADVPILFLSAKSQTNDVLKGFEVGANDYLKKPFNMDELLARLQVLLRTSKKDASRAPREVYVIGQYEFDFALQSIHFGSQKVQISFKESQLLKHLAKQINQTVEKDFMLKDIWGDNNVYTSKNMDVVITKLRTYFKQDTRISIVNQRGIGYKLMVED